MGLFHFTILLVFCTSLKTIHSLKNDQSPAKMDYIRALNQTVYAIEKLLSFYEDQINEVNLDAIYGLRVTEGALAFALTKYNRSFWKAFEISDIYENVRKLRDQAGSINNRAQTSIKNQGKDYYHKFKDIVDKPWTFFKDFGFRKLPVDEVQVVQVTGEKTTWDETTSDRCMSEVLGSNPNHTKCTFTPLCVKAITDQRQNGYGPTHQILFLTLALMHGCQERYSEVLKQHLDYDIDGLIENLCVKVMSEMSVIEQFGVKKGSRDLYMEQGFVCSIHGYEEFLTSKRLENVLSWQRKVGCFGNLNDENGNEDGEDERDIQDDGEQTGIFDDNKEEMGTLGVNRKRRMGALEGDLAVRSKKNVGSFRSMRRLLVDVYVAHGCSAHESGVAAGLLGSYTRWLLAKLDTSTKKPTITPKEMDLEISSLTNNPSSVNKNIQKNITSKTSSPTSIKNNPTTRNKNNPPTIGNNIKKNITPKTSSPTSIKNNPTTRNKNDPPTVGENNMQKNNVTAKTVYIRSLIISFVTSLLTVSVVLTLYKLGENCCNRRRSRGKYRPLIDT